MTDLKKLLGHNSNMTYVAAFIRKTKRVAWTLKQVKKQETQLDELFNGYVAQERRSRGNRIESMQNQNHRGCTAGNRAQRMEEG